MRSCHFDVVGYQSFPELLGGGRMMERAVNLSVEMFFF